MVVFSFYQRFNYFTFMYLYEFFSRIINANDKTSYRRELRKLIKALITYKYWMMLRI